MATDTSENLPSLDEPDCDYAEMEQNECSDDIMA
jgi:hypothetical protein